MTVEEELKNLRLSLGMTKTEFGKSFGVGSQMVSAYELGRSRVGNRTLSKINKVYGTEYKVVRECIICGAEFYPICPNGQCCPEHSNHKKYRSVPFEVVHKNKSAIPIVPIPIYNEQARSQGLNYGKLQQEEYKKSHPMVRIKDLRRV